MTDSEKELFEFITKGSKKYLNNMAVDNVILGYHEKELKVLLVLNPHFPVWMLPGGYIKSSESAEDATARVARERTGLDNLFLQQFKVFSTPGRNQDPHFTPQVLSQIWGQEVDESHWMFGPVISISSYTLTEFSKVNVNSSYPGEKCQWWNIDSVPGMFQDHNQIISEALKALRLHIYHYPIGYELLPEKFTLPEIRVLYETILGKQLDDRNFTRKLMSLNLIKKVNEVKTVSGHRPPNLYAFNMDVYKEALEVGTFIF
jgi:8-oxo-dGTP diphosphatase